MGSSTSKAARTASSTVRKYPSQVPPQANTTSTTNASTTRLGAATSTGPTFHPQTQASGSRDAAITRDASDPDLAFNARLSQLGPVQPSPTFSNSSTFNTPARLRASTPRSRGPASSQPPPQSQSQSQTQQPTPTASPAFQPSASTPSQTIFPSPASNPAVMLLAARSRLAQEAEEEFENLGRKGLAGRSFLDVLTIRQVLMLRDEQRKGPEEIERMLGLRRGLVGKLGPRGIYSGAGA